jgi:hypothetical protein
MRIAEEEAIFRLAPQIDKLVNKISTEMLSTAMVYEPSSI